MYKFFTYALSVGGEICVDDGIAMAGKGFWAEAFKWVECE